MVSRIAIFCVCLCLSVVESVVAASAPENELSLNGPWSFLLCKEETSGPQQEFYKPGFNASKWFTISVPSTWELQGFEEPNYNQPSHSVGLYRREFTAPAVWQGRHVVLRFAGVLYGFECWLNGQRIGSHESAYTPVQFDITTQVKYGAANLLAVRVYKPFPYCLFDCSDDWALSGIFRDVVISSLPSPYIKQVWTTTDYTDQALLTIEGTLDSFGGAIPENVTLSGRLRLPKGAIIGKFDLPLEPGTPKFKSMLTISGPRWWTAESPNLYELVVRLEQDGQILHSVTRSVGLCDVSIEEGVLKITGSPVKLRGVDRHEIHPEVGRAVREEDDRKDIQLMKAANITLVRTSHCPPHPRFLDMCDAQGLYVICEVPFDGGKELLNNPENLDRLLARADETVLTNRHHPCIILWSIGNENPYTPVVEAVARHVKELDSTRPICIPQGGGDFSKEGWTLPEFIDVLAPHYPMPQELEAFAQKTQRPIITTEYAHMLGKAAEDLGPCWDVILKYPKLAGGAIWHWADQGIYKNAAPDEYDKDLGKPLLGKIWVSPAKYMDCGKDKGADGIVYSDRQPQVDYWLTRKVYSPVYIAERDVATHPGLQTIAVTVSNRYDFTNLATLKGYWAFYQDAAKIAEGPVEVDLEPGESDTVSLDLEVPDTFGQADSRVVFSFFDAKNSPVYEHTVRLVPAENRSTYPDLIGESILEKSMELSTEGGMVRARFPEVDVEFDQTSGRFGMRMRENKAVLLAQSPYVRVGRLPTMAERRSREKRYMAKQSFWEPWLLTMAAPGEQHIDTNVSPPVIQVKGQCPRIDKENQLVEVEMTVTISTHGWVDVKYALTPQHCTGIFLEAGLSLALPKTVTKVYWVGDGPFISYPGADEASEHGLYTMQSTDLWFDGNRKNVEVAVLTDDAGNGVAMVCEPSNVAWEHAPEGILLSHNALVGGRGTKNTRTRYEYPVTEVGTIKGKFRIVPLIANKWPETLQRTFKNVLPSSIAAGPPYLREYD